ncbi:DUF7310 family coiled-coil domain-containing protein [Natronobeatus ordinarius]|uniref:DUF7310 family coiled-coil domain-containing protein n=1 Tax=Natronobeatus ordinarius TaxID=2963433 RepID=UPI0020CDAB6E|nr:hypothetical protein [Natronobeatus ordinarius]
MTDVDRLEQRLSAVERVVVDGDVALDELATLASLSETVSTLETRLEEHERRLADLEAAVQSIEGYVGNVESINDDVERQAATAVATVDRLERRMEALEVELDDLQGGILEGERERDEETVAERNGSVGTERDESVTLGFEAGEAGKPTPEQSVSELFGSDRGSRATVDDGVDRPSSTANQSAVDSALEEDEPSEPARSEGDGGTNDGLLDALRSRLS